MLSANTRGKCHYVSLWSVCPIKVDNRGHFNIFKPAFSLCTHLTWHILWTSSCHWYNVVNWKAERAVLYWLTHVSAQVTLKVWNSDICYKNTYLTKRGQVSMGKRWIWPFVHEGPWTFTVSASATQFTCLIPPSWPLEASVICDFAIGSWLIRKTVKWK